MSPHATRESAGNASRALVCRVEHVPDQHPYGYAYRPADAPRAEPSRVDLAPDRVVGHREPLGDLGDGEDPAVEVGSCGGEAHEPGRGGVSGFRVGGELAEVGDRLRKIGRWHAETVHAYR
jgi:hypothetical protein